tara:strand:+ start:349 stop:600 length:252 start_codon:yes stop_codon:yes gene_type:complete
MKYVLVNKLDEIVTKVELEKTSTISEAITYFQGIKKMPDTIEFNKLWKVMTENDYDMKFKSSLQNRQVEWWKEEDSYLDGEKS